MATATDPTFLQFVAAVRQQESDGNYSDRSAAGALGAYQVMPGNIGPWSAQALGHAVTVEQFMASPTLQDEIASYELLKYYNAYGARGAAAAWYSGDPTLQNDYTKDQYGQSPGDYADEVLSKMGKAPAVGVKSQRAWATPGHWVGAAGQPIADPPTPVRYNDKGNGGGPVLTTTKAQAKATYTDDQWNAIIAWLISYGGTATQDGPSLSSFHSPLSSNDKGFIFDLYAHTVTTQAQGTEFNPSTGQAQAGIGPLPNPLDVISKLLTLLSSGAFWKRVGLGAIGAIIIIGLALWMEKDKIGKAAAAVAV